MSPQVDSHHLGDTAVLTFRRDFDLRDEGSAFTALRLAVAGGAEHVELDFGRARFVGGAAVRLALHAVAGVPGSVTIRVRPDAARLFRLTGVDDRMTLVDAYPPATA